MEKVSLIITVRNEESRINELLQSIAAQSKKPDEVVFVDGDSTDGTVETIRDYAKKHPHLHMSLYEMPGNIAEGRNFAISKASYPLIAVTDAGCTLDTHWLEHLVSALRDPKIDIAAGYYEPYSPDRQDTWFQKSLAPYTSVMPDALNPDDFLPSSRSVSFKKKVWEDLGGYPEELDYAEDLQFFFRARQAGYTFQTVQKAIVYWPQRKTLKDAWLQFHRYAYGDGQAGYVRPQIYALFARYGLGAILIMTVLLTDNMQHQQLMMVTILVGLGVYILWAIKKNYRYVRHWSAFMYLPLLQFTADVAVILGTIRGFAWRLTSRYRLRP